MEEPNVLYFELGVRDILEKGEWKVLLVNLDTNGKIPVEVKTVKDIVDESVRQEVGFRETTQISTLLTSPLPFTPPK